jgi:hypothetical protein
MAFEGEPMDIFNCMANFPTCVNIMIIGLIVVTFLVLVMKIKINLHIYFKKLNKFVLVKET